MKEVVRLNANCKHSEHHALTFRPVNSNAEKNPEVSDTFKTKWRQSFSKFVVMAPLVEGARKI